MTNSAFIVVLSTASSKEEAKKIARALINESAAACVNIIKNDCSIYRWDNEVCEESEYQLIIKTKKTLFEKVMSVIQKMHSYDVPEIISIDISGGSESYLKWIDETTF